MADQELAPGAAAYQRLLDGGFTGQEAEDWKQQQTAKLVQAGFKPDEVNAYWGETPPDTSRIDNDARAAVQSAGATTYGSDPLSMFQAGLMSSSSGVALNVLRGKNPNVVAPEHAGWLYDGLKMSGQIIGDLPATVLGAVGGAAGGAAAGAAVGPEGAVAGGIAGAGAGGNALPVAIRETLMDYYQNRGGNYFRDFWTRYAHITASTGKAMVTGAISSVIGGKVGGKLLEAGASEFAAGGANLVTQATTGTAIGAAMDGRVPNKEDFVLAAAAALGFHAAGALTGRKANFTPQQQDQVSQNLHDIYARTGVHPNDAVERAKADAGFRQEIFASRAANGDPVTPAHDAINPGDSDPYVKPERSPDLSGLKNGGFAVHDEHADMMRQLQGEAEMKVGQKATPEQVQFALDKHLDLIESLEGSAAYAKRKGIGVDDVVSPAGAIGRYQVTPATAKTYGFDPSKLTDPAYNRAAAEAIVSDLARRYPGDLAAQLIAYNAGPGRANSFIANGRKIEQLPLETQRYLEHAQRLGANLGSDFIGQNIDRQLTVQGDNGGWVPPRGNVGGGGGGGGKEPPAEGEIIPPERGPRKLADNGIFGEDALRDRIMDIVAPTEEPSKLRDFLDFINPRTRIAEFQSELEPARSIDKMAGLSPEKIGVEDMLRQTYASKERAGYFVRYGTLSPEQGRVVETSKASFMEAYKAVKEDGGDLAGFTAYRLAKRALEKEEQGIDTGVDTADAKRYVSMTADKYERANGIMREVKDASIDYAVKSGRFSPELAEAIKSLNQEHIVMRRLVDENYRPNVGRLFRARNPLKKMTGSDKQIVDPVTAEIDNLHSIIAESDRNRAVGALVDAIDAYQKKLGETPLLEKVEFDEEGNKVLTGTLIDEQGHVIPQKVAAAAEPFIAERQLGKLLGPNDFIYYRNGKPEIWRSRDEDLTQLLRTPMPTKMNPVVSFVQKFASLQRAGITSAFEFPFRVFFHSQIASAAFGERTTVPFHDTMRGLLDVFSLGDKYKEWVANGGAGVALSDMDVNYIQKDINKVWQGTGTADAVFNVVKHPIDAMRMMQHMLDAASRVGYYKRLTEQGVEPMKAATMSRKAFLDFGEKQTASWVNTWAKMVPFMPSGIKDLEQVGAAIRDRPVTTLTKAAIYFTLPTVTLWALNRQRDANLDPDDPSRYDQTPRWARDMYWMIPVNGTFIKVQKPYVGSFPFSTLVERALDNFAEKDPHAMDEWAKALGEQMVPPYMPSILTPVVEDKFNKSLFTGRPLVPASLEKASGYLQYTPNTSETAKKIAQILGPAGMNVADVSPIVLQNYARQWAGTMPMTILRVFEKPMKGPSKPSEMADNPFVGSFFLRHPDMSSYSIQNFMTDFDKVEKAHTDFRLALEHQDTSEIDTASKDFRAFVDLNTIKEAITNQMNVIKQINDDADMTPDEKRQYTDSIVSGSISLAKAGSMIAEEVGRGD